MDSKEFAGEEDKAIGIPLPKSRKSSYSNSSESESEKNQTSNKDKESYVTNNPNYFNYSEIKLNLPVKELSLRSNASKRIKNTRHQSPFQSAKQIAIYASGKGWG